MGSASSSGLFGKKVNPGTDKRQESSEEDEDDDVRYDGPLDLNQIVLLYSQKYSQSERREKPDLEEDIQDDMATTESTVILARSTRMSVPPPTLEVSLCYETTGRQSSDKAYNPPSVMARQEVRRLACSAEDVSRAEERAPGVVETRLGENGESERRPTAKPMAWEIDLTDLATPKDLKRKKSAKGVANKVLKKDSSSPMSPRKDAYIPPTVTVTSVMLAERKVLDQRRWFCISRPQYSKSCGLSSLVSCWNYLFSTLGAGTHRPITQEEALTVLGFEPPFGEIRFGPFTGNATLMRWFRRLNNQYGTRGKAYHIYKPVGKARTVGRTSDDALRLLKAGLRDTGTTFIYHCWNHYFCPVGFEEVPKKAADAFRGPLSEDEVNSWILVADPSRKQPGIHCFRWEDISTDLNCKSPECLNIRKLHLGVQTRKTKRLGGNLHCLMAFKRSSLEGVTSLRQRDKCLGEGRPMRLQKGGGWILRNGVCDEVLQMGGYDEVSEGLPAGGCGVNEVSGTKRCDEVNKVAQTGVCQEAREGPQSGSGWVTRLERVADEVDGRCSSEEGTDKDLNEDILDEGTDSSE